MIPFLQSNTESIHEAQLFVETLSQTVQYLFMKRMGEVKLKEIPFLVEVKADSPHYPKYKAILELFAEETLTDFIGLMDGMKNAIEGELRVETYTRGFKELDIKL